MSSEDQRRNRRVSRRRKKEEKDEPSFSHELVEIERNFIEQTLLNLKHWTMANKSLVRNIVYGLVGFGFLLFIFIFLNAQAADTHSAEYFRILQKYEAARILPEGDVKQKEMKAILKDAGTLCDKIWSTDASKNGCLLKGLSGLQIGDNTQAAIAFEKFADHYNSQPPASYGVYYAAVAREQSGDFEKAYSLFDRLQELYEPIKKEDIAIYHKARILYQKGDYKTAVSMFREIIDHHKTSSYIKKSREYIALIGALAK